MIKKATEIRGEGESLEGVDVGTASGLRMQNCEIKYKKPTGGRGAQKSGNFRRRPRGYLARISAEFRKFFLARHGRIPR
jgi:hypothetical protein